MSEFKTLFKNKQIIIKPLKKFIKLNEDSFVENLEGEVVQVGNRVENYKVGDFVLFDTRLSKEWKYGLEGEVHFKLNDEMYITCELLK